ncbi:LLM class flavin-dependent oxidoreductase [Haloplanus sp. GCM10025708]|uniref:LLM class flavin-dependent oxidoreductase n=1 Tax=Haloferacaceae TaxID=1644056 RepID=UPI003616E31A
MGDAGDRTVPSVDYSPFTLASFLSGFRTVKGVRVPVSRDMKFGLFVNPQAPAGTAPTALADDLLAQTEAARDAGFDLVTTGQHYLADYAQLQLMPLLARMTAVSGSMRVGSGIVLLPLHHPVEIAEQLTTLSALCDGVVAGVGAGYRDVEFESFGIPKEERAGRLAEGVELMNRLWTEENVTFDGEFYSVDDVSITPRPAEKPDVWVAANARRAVERAARIGDAWFVNPHATVAEIREQKRQYDAVREERGEDTDVPVFREAFVAPTRDEAVSAAREHLEAKYQRYIEWGQDEAMEDQEDLHRSFEELAEDRFVLGTPEEACAEIERYEEELNASDVVLRVCWPGMDNERAVECIERIGDDVIPHV